MNASVKVMLSYDYCHFEIALSADVDTLDEVNDLRKDTQRLADEAVRQYKVAKKKENERSGFASTAEETARKAKAIIENFPKSEWTPEQQAVVKKYDDAVYQSGFRYDYSDEEEPAWTK